MNDTVNKSKIAMVDLDGTLVDTKALNFYAYKEALKECNVLIDEKDFDNFFGRHYKDFLSEIFEDQSMIERVHDRKIRIYENNIDKAVLNVHLVDILIAIKNNYIISLVTTASKNNTMKLLEHFKLIDLFDCIITGDDVSKRKPDPMCYNLLLERFNIKNEDAIIFEDSKTGIEAAKCVTNNIFKIVS